MFEAFHLLLISGSQVRVLVRPPSKIKALAAVRAEGNFPEIVAGNTMGTPVTYALAIGG
jgi:hypothetical protein